MVFLIYFISFRGSVRFLLVVVKSHSVCEREREGDRHIGRQSDNRLRYTLIMHDLSFTKEDGKVIHFKPLSGHFHFI